MSLPDVVDRATWVAARKELLAREKAATRAKDSLNQARRELPMVAIDKEYQFTGPGGPASLADLFEGRRQLIVQHVMFGPDWDAACPGCTAALDEVSPGLLRHLHTRDTTFAAVSRTSVEKIGGYQAAHGWDFPWYSSLGSDFNYDFHVTLDEAVAPVEYNYRTPAEYAPGSSGPLEGEQPGYSCFLIDDGRIFHTYSVFARGTEMLGGSYAYLDMTALGRQEEWEEPKGRADRAREANPTFAD